MLAELNLKPSKDVTLLLKHTTWKSCYHFVVISEKRSF